MSKQSIITPFNDELLNTVRQIIAKSDTSGDSIGDIVQEKYPDLQEMINQAMGEPLIVSYCFTFTSFL